MSYLDFLSGHVMSPNEKLTWNDTRIQPISFVWFCDRVASYCSACLDKAV